MNNETYSKLLQDKVLSYHTEIWELCEKRGFNNPRLFGSVANDTATDTSDIDIMVSPKGKLRYFQQGGLNLELEELLELPVDVVVDTEVYDAIRLDILKGNVICI